MSSASCPILFLLILHVVISIAASHSWLSLPLTYNIQFLDTCSGKECLRACPVVLTSGVNNSISDPAAQYKRGQSTSIRYVKNNHFGGLMRLSIVPVSAMFSRDAHSSLAFYYTCWDSHEVDCKDTYVDCGTDYFKRAFETTVTIPTCFPNGDYVMGYVWYGGLNPRGPSGNLGDYFHCSHIKIAGGPLSKDCEAVYDNGGTGDSVRGTECRTHIDEPGYCRDDRKCRGRRPFFATPKAFENGVPRFSQEDVRRTGSSSDFSRSPIQTPIDDSSPNPLQSITPEPSPSHWVMEPPIDGDFLPSRSPAPPIAVPPEH